MSSLHGRETGILLALMLWRNAEAWSNIPPMRAAAVATAAELPEPGEELVRYFGDWDAPPNAFTGHKRRGWYWRNVATLAAWAGPTPDRGVAIRNARDNQAPKHWF